MILRQENTTLAVIQDWRLFFSRQTAYAEEKKN